jgi:plasmid stabilization system protein ParE
MGFEKISLTESALEDMESVEADINSYSPRLAKSIISRFFDKFDLIGTFPEMGRVVPEIGNPFIREVFHKKYRIIYLVKENSIEILRVIHGSKLIDLK